MKKLLICILFIFLHSNLVFAGSTLEMDNDGEIEVKVSKFNPNRLKVVGDRITNVRYNVEDLDLDYNQNSGEVFFKPKYKKDKFDIFLSTEMGNTYKLTLVVDDLPSQQIFIRKKDFTLQNYAEGSILSREKEIEDNSYFNFDEDYKISAINLIRLMESLKETKDFSIVSRDGGVLKYKEGLSVAWLFSFIKNDHSTISGEVLRVTNKSSEKVDLKEEDFFKKGIRAVSLSKLTLEPKESCHLYQVGGGK
jgi:type-F conjugative transfer system secretin TraK